MGVYDWSATAADNDDADSAINWLEGQAPSTVNNSARSMMAELAKWIKDNNGTVTTGGSSNDYTVGSNNSYLSLVDGTTILVEANHTNTGAATLNVDAIGAVAVVRDADVALVGGEIKIGGRYLLSYDSGLSKWLLLNPTGAFTSVNNNFTEGQTVTKAAADANIIASRTGAGASGAFMGAHNAKAVFGSNTNVQVDYVINGVAKGSLGVSGGYFTPGLTDAGAGTFNTAGYFRNSVALPIQRSNQTSETASTAGSLITLTHGFSAVPSLVQAWAVCKAAEGNYSIGDIVVLNNASNNPSGAASIGIQIFYDTTNCFARVASGGFGLLFDRTTGTAFTPTVSSWNIVLKAWV